MKFLCLKCEAYMTFQKVEEPAQGSLGVFFACARCGATFCMVTNPGETQLVSSLGVQLGGRTSAPAPFEMTRRMLDGAPTSAPESSAGEGLGRCPFGSVVKSMQAPAAPPLDWSPGAHARLGNIPEMVRPFARLQIEKMARERGMREVDETLLDEARDTFMG